MMKKADSFVLRCKGLLQENAVQSLMTAIINVHMDVKEPIAGKPTRYSYS